MSRRTKANRMADSLVNISKPIEEDYERIVRKTKPSGIDIEMVNVDMLIPAPAEWNFFPKLSEMKMLEMMFSIMENGLFNPVIAWEQDDEHCMILSGHNRVEAFRRLDESYDTDEYKQIPSIIYGRNEINEAKAREIIIDTNYIQREEDLSILPLIVKHRKEFLERQKDRKGNTLMMVAKELNIGRTRAYKLNKIATEVIPELTDLYYNKVLTQDNVLKFSWYNEGFQKKIHDRYLDKISNDTMNALKQDMGEAEIKEIFNKGKGEKIANILFKVPEKESDRVRSFVTRYLSMERDRRKYVEKILGYYSSMMEEDIEEHLDMLKVANRSKKKGVR